MDPLGVEECDGALPAVVVDVHAPATIRAKAQASTGAPTGATIGPHAHHVILTYAACRVLRRLRERDQAGISSRTSSVERNRSAGSCTSVVIISSSARVASSTSARSFSTVCGLPMAWP